MIVKVNTGSDAARVTDYLTRRQEQARDGERVELHTDPHLIAGSQLGKRRGRAASSTARTPG